MRYTGGCAAIHYLALVYVKCRLSKLTGLKLTGSDVTSSRNKIQQSSLGIFSLYSDSITISRELGHHVAGEMLSFIQNLPRRAHWMSPVHTGASQTLCDRHASDGGGDGPDLSPWGTRRGENLRIAYALRVRTLRIHFEVRDNFTLSTTFLFAGLVLLSPEYQTLTVHG
ncbi:hypothetical protein EV363DRAFT_755578 [Boletus edulis]|nr:hypothetical protein EV363DRAFT_755578 [Boletus edulis]